MCVHFATLNVWMHMDNKLHWYSLFTLGFITLQFQLHNSFRTSNNNNALICICMWFSHLNGFGPNCVSKMPKSSCKGALPMFRFSKVPRKGDHSQSKALNGLYCRSEKIKKLQPYARSGREALDKSVFLYFGWLDPTPFFFSLCAPVQATCWLIIHPD